jgi:hypothetical protein
MSSGAPNTAVLAIRWDSDRGVLNVTCFRETEDHTVIDGDYLTVVFHHRQGVPLLTRLVLTGVSTVEDWTTRPRPGVATARRVLGSMVSDTVRHMIESNESVVKVALTAQKVAAMSGSWQQLVDESNRV